MTQIGATFGLAISTIVFNKVLKNESLNYGVVVNLAGSNAPQEAQLKAYQAAMWTGEFAPCSCHSMRSDALDRIRFWNLR